MIFACAGSREYPFNRLFQKIDELIEEGVIKEEVFAQIGTSTYKPKFYEYKNYVANEEFNQYIHTSRLIITHGGTGSIVGALKNGKQVIAVARLSKFGEHIDDHQQQIVELFSKEHYIYGVSDINKLRDGIIYFEKEPYGMKKFEKESYILTIIDEFIKKSL